MEGARDRTDGAWQALWLTLGALIAATGCLPAGATTCPGELVCPADHVCWNGGCASNEQIAACAAAIEGATCAVAGIEHGVCHLRACISPRCGDGFLDPSNGEACDLGEANSTLADAACRPDCNPSRCGDGTVDSATEVCDDANILYGDGCAGDCRSDESCGNDRFDPIAGEECDLGRGLTGDGCSSGCRVELPGWAPWQPPVFARRDHALAYFPPRQRLVLFGGDNASTKLGDTWLFDGVSWSKQVTAAAPSARSGHALAYDAARTRLVLFGGSGAIASQGFTDDTWEFDGATWIPMAPTLVPSIRAQHAMAFDAARNRVVMFGGLGGSLGAPVALGDTWTYDGVSWSDISQPLPAPSPGAREGHVMAYDPETAKVLLYGAQAFLWQLDGADWSEVVVSGSSPRSSAEAAMSHHPGASRIVFYVGIGVPASETWEYKSGTWTRYLGGPPTRSGAAMAYFPPRDALILVGGTDVLTSAALADTWSLSSTFVWGNLTLPSTPPARRGHALAYDADGGRVVLFGGTGASGRLSDTWEYNGASWRMLQPVTSPPARDHHALAHDGRAHRVVLFGGTGSSGLLDDTWALLGGTWTPVLGSDQTPPPRDRHALAFDSAGQRLMLFGGSGAAGLLDDTWELDGGEWSPRALAGRPPARRRHALSDDPAHARVVLHGGMDDLGVRLDDTWSYQGSSWTLSAAGGPPAVASHSLAFNPSIGRIVRFGGDGETGRIAESWELDGSIWSELTVSTAPAARDDHALAFDAIRGQIVLFGGTDGGSPLADTWAFGYANASTPAEACLDGALDSDGDGDVGCDDPDCWGRCAPACPPGTPCLADAPRCEDDACASAIEDHLICAADCESP